MDADSDVDMDTVLYDNADGSGGIYAIFWNVLANMI